MRILIVPLSAAAILGSIAILSPELHAPPSSAPVPGLRATPTFSAALFRRFRILYFRTDAYHYNGDADRTIFNGFAQVGVRRTTPRLYGEVLAGARH